MKKLILTVFFSVLYLTSASADMGVNVGVSGQAGVFTASGKETNPTTSADVATGSEHGEAAWASVFAEVSVGDRFMLGIDYVPESLETESVESVRKQTGVASAVTRTENKVQVDFEDYTTYYAAMMVTDNLFVKVGAATVEVITNENLGTGSKYGNADIFGGVIGVGMSEGPVRFELVYTDYEDVSLTSSVARTGVSPNNKIEAELDSVALKLSYAF